VSVVVDSSTIVAALVDTGPVGAWAEQVIAGHALYAPELVHVEATNVLRRLELAIRITTPGASAAQEDLMQLEIELFPFEPFAERIWELRHTVTGYDAWYVAVAEALGFPLATLDERLAKCGGPKCEFLTPESLRAPHRGDRDRQGAADEGWV
jgi:predicted nucleic acid-binding protein